MTPRRRSGCASRREPLFVLVVPGEALDPDLIVVGVLLAGGLIEIGLLIFDRQALETDPGAVSVVAD